MVCPTERAARGVGIRVRRRIRSSPDPDTCSDAEWSSYVFDRPDLPASIRMWCHIASALVHCLRDTARISSWRPFRRGRATRLPPVGARSRPVRLPGSARLDVSLEANPDEWIDRSSRSRRVRGQRYQGSAATHFVALAHQAYRTWPAVSNTIGRPPHPVVRQSRLQYAVQVTGAERTRRFTLSPRACARPRSTPSATQQRQAGC